MHLRLRKSDAQSHRGNGSLKRSVRLAPWHSAAVNIQRVVFDRMYKRAPSIEALPWHRDEPPRLLQRAMEERAEPGRGLDLGCGAGVYAVDLARSGWSVVATDFVQTALDAAAARAEVAGVEVQLERCDVVDFRDPEPFDIVLDSGCLHHLPKGKVATYREQLDEWLAPGGSFVLVHFLHRPKIKWIPQGPRHLTPDAAAELFAPLELRDYDETEFEVPFPMGTMRAGVYWFKRPP